MEPNQTAQTVKSTPGEDIVFRDVDKKRKGMIIGMICLAILAAGGIGFGVWAYMDGNSRVEALNSQINTLKIQKDTLDEQVEALKGQSCKASDELEESMNPGNKASEGVETEDAVWNDPVEGANTHLAPGSATQSSY